MQNTTPSGVLITTILYLVGLSRIKNNYPHAKIACHAPNKRKKD